jgi:hypothetical protein
MGRKMAVLCSEAPLSAHQVCPQSSSLWVVICMVAHFLVRKSPNVSPASTGKPELAATSRALWTKHGVREARRGRARSRTHAPSRVGTSGKLAFHDRQILARCG